MKNILWAALLCALFLFAPSVMARDLDRYSDMNWTTTGNTATGVPAAGAGPSGYGNSPGGPHAFGKKPLPWPGKSQAENMAKWKTMASPRNLARSWMSPAAAIPMFAGMAFKALMDAACTRIAGGSMQLADGGLWEECNMKQEQGLEWRASAAYHTTSWLPSKGHACQAFLAWHQQNGAQSCTVNGNTEAVQRSIYEQEAFCGIRQTCGGAGGTTDYQGGFSNRTAIVTVQDGWKPVSEASAEDKIAQKLEQWCADDLAKGESYQGSCLQVMRDFLEADGKVAGTQLPLTGPASHTAPPVTKTETQVKSDPQGTTTITITTTTKTTYYYTYNGQTVTTTQKNEETKTTTGPNGEPISEETTTEEEEPAETPATDTALADAPKLYEPKYPDGPKGVWDTQLALIKATPLFQLPAQLAPNLGDSHGCPQWTVPIDVGIAGFGVQNASIPCNVWAFLRICVIVGALFLARALVFGG